MAEEKTSLLEGEPESKWKSGVTSFLKILVFLVNFQAMAAFKDVMREEIDLSQNLWFAWAAIIMMTVIMFASLWSLFYVKYVFDAYHRQKRLLHGDALEDVAIDQSAHLLGTAFGFVLACEWDALVVVTFSINTYTSLVSHYLIASVVWSMTTLLWDQGMPLLLMKVTGGYTKSQATRVKILSGIIMGAGGWLIGQTWVDFTEFVVQNNLNLPLLPWIMAAGVVVVSILEFILCIPLRVRTMRPAGKLGQAVKYWAMHNSAGTRCAAVIALRHATERGIPVTDPVTGQQSIPLCAVYMLATMFTTYFLIFLDHDKFELSNVSDNRGSFSVADMTAALHLNPKEDDEPHSYLRPGEDEVVDLEAQETRRCCRCNPVERIVKWAIKTCILLAGFAFYYFFANLVNNPQSGHYWLYANTSAIVAFIFGFVANFCFPKAKPQQHHCEETWGNCQSNLEDEMEQLKSEVKQLKDENSYLRAHHDPTV